MGKTDIKTFSLAIGFLLFACLLASGCKEPEIASYCVDHPMNIDGKYGDWPNSATYYYEKEKVIINLLNDSEYFYICLITRNRQIEEKIMESGLLVWFDPQAGKNRVFGIRFPAAAKSMGIPRLEKDPAKDWHDQEDKSGLIDREKERLKDRDFNTRIEALEKLAEKLEVITIPQDTDKSRQKPPKKRENFDDGPRPEPPPKEHGKEFTLEDSAKIGIEAKLGRDNDYFVCELKVPLKKSPQHIYAIEPIAGKAIGLGISLSDGPLMGHGLASRKSMPMPGFLDDSDEGNFQLWLKISLCQS